MKITVFAVALMTCFNPAILMAQSDSAMAASIGIEDKSVASEFLRIQIDKIQIDTAGLVHATDTLSGNIDQLSNSIENLSKSNASLSTEDRAAIVTAAQSVDSASQAISKLASQLPITAAQINQDLTNIINNSASQITAISSGIQSASSGVIAITQSYPEAVENSKRLANEVLTSGLNTVSAYTTGFLVLLVLTIAAIVYVFYRIVITPIINKLDELQTIPAQLAEMSTQMAVTSNNLLKLQRHQRLGKNRIENYLR